MSETFDWPEAFKVNGFEMRVAHNTRAFFGQFTSTAQMLNYTGERWQGVVSLVPGNRNGNGPAQEAFFDRLDGPANRIRLWNLQRPHPLGTLRDGVPIPVVNGALAAVSVVNGSAAAVTVVSGAPANITAIAIGASTTTLQTYPGRTLEAGDHIGLPNGQNVRIMASATANGAGVMSIEFQPRARTAIAAYGAIVWDRPTVDVMLKTDGVSIKWRPGMHESTSFDFIEAV